MKKLRLLSLTGLFAACLLFTSCISSDDPVEKVSPVVGEWVCPQFSLLNSPVTLKMDQNGAVNLALQTYYDPNAVALTRAGGSYIDYVKIAGSYTHNETTNELTLKAATIQILDDDDYTTWTSYTWEEFIEELMGKDDPDDIRPIREESIRLLTKATMSVDDDDDDMDEEKVEEVRKALQEGVITVALTWKSSTQVSANLFDLIELDFYTKGTEPEIEEPKKEDPQ